jgi:hypothetical protein
MKLKATERYFDVFQLFVHDSDHRPSHLNESLLENLLNEALASLTSYTYEVLEFYNSAGRNWNLNWKKRDGPERHIEKRLYSASEVKEYLPAELVLALERLNRLSFDLSPPPAEETKGLSPRKVKASKKPRAKRA